MTLALLGAVFVFIFGLVGYLVVEMTAPIVDSEETDDEQ
jgi:hypothetical protein